MDGRSADLRRFLGPQPGRTRLAVRVLGRAQLPVGEAVPIEQYAAGIGLVLRREHVADFGPSETVLEEIREETPAPRATE